MDSINCKSLSEVRSNIDRIDQLIIQLIAERSSYVNQAANFKKTEQEVEASNRVKEVILKIRNLANTNKLNPDIAEKIYRTMIDAFIVQEKKQINTNELLSDFITPPDHTNFLAKKIFGKIDSILDCSIAYIEPNGGGPIKPHKHEHSHLFIVIEGEIIIKLENKEMKLGVNDYFLAKGNTDHSVWNVSNSRCVMIGISITD